jgi:23S rRNA (cytidine2498-2'-O)-methyltransferase
MRARHSQRKTRDQSTGGQRERAQRGAKQGGEPARTGKGERPRTGTATGERTGKGERPRAGKATGERTGKGERPRTGKATGERTGKGERPRTGKPTGERLAKGERPRAGKPTGERLAKGERPRRSERVVKGERPRTLSTDRSRSERGERPRSERSGERPRTERGGERPRTERGERPFAGRGGERPRAGKPVRGGERAAFAGRPSAARGERKPFFGADKSDDVFGERPVRDARPEKFDHHRRDDKKPAKPEKKERASLTRPVRVALSAPRGGLQVGDWLLTTREGSEEDLVDELVLANVVQPPAHVLAPSLVVSPKLPKREHQIIPLTFARQGFQVLVNVRHDDWDVLIARLAKAIAGKLERAEQYALQVWVPDSTIANPLASFADQLDTRLDSALRELLPDAQRVDDSALRRLGSMPFAQVCVLEQGHAAAGVSYSNQAISLAKGGRTRVRVTGDLPSRAARKIEEALAWLGVSPGPGETCVDLGAAPGGWTYVLSEKRARVIAVDPAKLRPEIVAKRNVVHLTENAFTFVPSERVDWLFCDMAYRPLEVAALLARWGRRGWARTLVANIKLPMKKKAEILQRVVDILSEEGEWKHVRTRQLYHDRDEITVTAHRNA